ncbi:PhnD/SsuA/transferrin family substrate-binding protein [Methylomicrobium sp. Wu6]|nr:PhnD/SsuA/transferrin family substrate-binding protein [Methylomicrobium sp. Wu6]
MSQATLQIQPQPSAEALLQKFTLIGTIDVDAITALETLYVLPPNAAAELDFALVQRVNSMGLAQLLKLFDFWQKRDISIRVTHANRMIGVLFKMTGLTRFLAEEETSSALSATPSQQWPATPVAPPSPSTVATATPLPPAFKTAIEASAAVARIPAPLAASSPQGKLRLLINAQSSQQMNGWYFFNTYLQKRLGKEIHMELAHGAITENNIRAEQMDIVFAKPFDATRLLLQNGFRPILRPIDQTDEVTLLVRADDTREQACDYRGGKAVTADPDNFIYLLGRFLLDESGSTSKDLDYHFTGNEIKALQTLLKGQADMLFMSSKTYQGLSGLTRKMLREMDRSETALAFHVFCVAPHCAGIGEALARVLLDMNRDSQGRQVLADLGIEGWIGPTHDEIDMLTMLFTRYAANDGGFHQQPLCTS